MTDHAKVNYPGHGGSEGYRSPRIADYGGLLELTADGGALSHVGQIAVATVPMHPGTGELPFTGFAGASIGAIGAIGAGLAAAGLAARKRLRRQR